MKSAPISAKGNHGISAHISEYSATLCKRYLWYIRNSTPATLPQHANITAMILLHHGCLFQTSTAVLVVFSASSLADWRSVRNEEGSSSNGPWVSNGIVVAPTVSLPLVVYDTRSYQFTVYSKDRYNGKAPLRVIPVSECPHHRMSPRTRTKTKKGQINIRKGNFRTGTKCPQSSAAWITLPQREQEKFPQPFDSW